MWALKRLRLGGSQAKVATGQSRTCWLFTQLLFRLGPGHADEEFELLMELTGAAGADDMASGAPGVNVQHPATGASALMVAAAKGRADVAAVLLGNGADPKLKARDGSTGARA